MGVTTSHRATGKEAVKVLTPVSDSLHTKDQLQAWLDNLYDYVKQTHGQRWRGITDMMEDWRGTVENGTLFIDSRKYQDASKKGRSSVGVYLSALNRTYIKAFCNESQRYRIARRDDGFKLLPVGRPPHILEDSFSPKIKKLLKETTDLRQVVVVQHSGKSTSPLIAWLLKSGVDVKLYLQNPEVAVNDKQHLKVLGDLRDARAYYDHEVRVEEAGTLKIYTIDAPLTVRMIIVPDRLIILGSYYYYPTKDPNAAPSGMNIMGHLLPLIALRRGGRDFAHLNRMVNRITRDLLRKARRWPGRSARTARTAVKPAKRGRRPRGTA